MATKHESVVAMLSGGLDSSVVAYQAARDHRKVVALTFDYGQPSSSSQIAASRRICRRLDIKLEVVDISGLRFSMLGLSDSADLPLGFAGSDMANCPYGLFGLTATYARLLGASSVYTGINAGDLSQSPRAEKWLKEFSRLTSELNGSKFALVSPCLRLTKAKVLNLGVSLKVPFELTWSCSSGSVEHCGVCKACTERRAGFKTAKLQDPTSYCR